MENTALYILSAIFLAVLLLNVCASIIIFRTYFVVKNRRTYQIIFVWLVPIIGAAMAIYLNREEYFEKRHKSEVGNHPNISNSEAGDFAVAANQDANR